MSTLTHKPPPGKEVEPTAQQHRSPQPIDKPVTLATLVKWAANGEKFACLTSYDATTARWFQQAGVPALLVGDTAAEIILGLPGTIHAPLNFMIQITAGVKRGAPNCFVIADMPFMSYQPDEVEGIRNAGRFMTEGLADAVKIEVDQKYVSLVEKMVNAGIPVIAHLGSLPQRSKQRGGYKSVGRTVEEARRLVADAVAMQEAGAVMLLVEAVPTEVTQRIIENTTIPVIGCGAGPACHSQVVVTQDLLGLTPWQPAFARPIVNLGEHLITTAQLWIEKVKTSDLGNHPYQMLDGEKDRF